MGYSVTAALGNQCTREQMSVTTTLKPKALPVPHIHTPKAKHGNSVQFQADPCGETTAFNQLMQAMGRAYGPHLGMEKIDSFCDLQEFFLCQPAPTFSLLLQGPQFLQFRLEKNVASLSQSHLLLQLTVQVCAVIQLHPKVL